MVKRVQGTRKEDTTMTFRDQNLQTVIQPRCNIVKDEKGDLVADSQSIVARWRNYFSQLFNVHGVKEVRQA